MTPHSQKIFHNLAKPIEKIAEASWSAVLRTALECAKKRQGLPNSKTLARSLTPVNKTKYWDTTERLGTRPIPALGPAMR
jgi:hypothetical protein